VRPQTAPQLPAGLLPFVPLTPLIGREAELGDIEQTLEITRMITITGVGGVGKSRLAFEAVARISAVTGIDSFVVELAALEGAQQLPAAIHEAIRSVGRPSWAAAGASPLDDTAAIFADREVLLVLDNCEHLTDAAASAALHLLRRCPGLRVVATSRQPLGIDGETIWQAPPLSLPQHETADPIGAVGESEAGSLFVERATRSQPTFALTSGNAPHVANICRELDGLPLAIELVAARVRVLTPEQIERELTDRLRLAGGGPRSAPERHRTLTGSLDWSYQRLDEAQRSLFRRLAISRDWTLGAIEAVCADDAAERATALDTITALVDRGLVAVVGAGDEFRYRMLETVRSYALDRLRDAGEERELRGRHLQHFRLLAADVDQLVADPAGRSRLEADRPHLRSALEFALIEDSALALAIAADLGHWWLLHDSYQEPREICSRVLAAEPAGDPRARAQVMWAMSLLAILDEDYAQARVYAEEGFPLAQLSGDAKTIGRWMIMAGNAQRSIDAGRAAQIGLEAVRILGDAGDDHGLAFALANLALTEGMRDNFAALREICSEFVSLPGDRPPWLLPWIENALAWADIAQGDPRSAVERCRRSIELGRGGTSIGRYVAISHQLHAMALLGEGREALELGVGQLERARRAGLTQAAMALDHGITYAELAVGEFDRAQTRAERGADDPHVYSAALSREVLIRIALARGEADVARQHAAVVRSTGEAAGSVRLVALADWADGRTALLSGELRIAYRLLHAALKAESAQGLRPEMIDTLEALGDLALLGEDDERGTRLLAAADAARRALGIAPPAPGGGGTAETVSVRVRGRVRYSEAWNEGARLSLQDAVEYAQRGRRLSRRPESGWESLTPIEASVAALAAEGLTNPEISGQLFISRGTVKYHLSHVYGKLGIKNRLQLGAFVRAGESSR
jgi:predicted ATPase/DNA-binding CsgD family transcriptional regulator